MIILAGTQPYNVINDYDYHILFTGYAVDVMVTNDRLAEGWSIVIGCGPEHLEGNIEDLEDDPWRTGPTMHG